MRSRILYFVMALIMSTIVSMPVFGQNPDRMLAPVLRAGVQDADKEIDPISDVPAPPNNPSIKMEGVVTASYDELPGVIVVNDYVIQVDASTLISPAGYKPEVNDLVVVIARVEQDEYQARVIYIDTGAGEGRNIEFRGLIEQLPDDPADGRWVISSIGVNVDRRATIDEPTVGFYAHVQGIVGPGGMVQATRIQVYDPQDVTSAFEIEGYIEQIGDVGTRWIIANVQGLVTDTTELIGSVLLGAYAEVCGHREPNGEILFDKIRVWSSEERQIQIEGLVEEINVEDGFGYWIVAGQHVEVDERTFVDESRARTQIGMWADVTALPSDPYPYALRIRVRRPE